MSEHDYRGSDNVSTLLAIDKDRFEERAIGGLGIHLVRKLMDGLEYKRQGERNFLTIKKKTQES